MIKAMLNQSLHSKALHMSAHFYCYSLFLQLIYCMMYSLLFIQISFIDLSNLLIEAYGNAKYYVQISHIYLGSKQLVRSLFF